MQAWEDVSLTLETVTPTFGLAIPVLTPWWLSVYNHRRYSRALAADSLPQSLGGSAVEKRKTLVSQQCAEVEISEDMGFSFGGPEMRKRIMRVASKGDISASFAVPGLISVPSDGVSHNVTVCELALDSVMSWVSVPKKDARAHLTVCSSSFVRAISRRLSDCLDTG
jgi:hypothetical protein